MEISNVNSETAPLATDITGAWKISWTDETGNTGDFEIDIRKGPTGLPYIVGGIASLPFDSGFFLGNTIVSGQSVAFTLGIFMEGRTGNFNFKIPELGGSGTFDVSILLCDGLKSTRGTCKSARVG